MYCEIQEMNVKSVSGEEKQIWNNRYYNKFNNNS